MSDLASEHDAVLAELLQLGLAAARKVTARLEAAEDDETVSRLGHTFSRVTRAVRQTVALREKLARDRKIDLREARDEEASQAKARRTHRRDQVKAAVERLIWTEYENDEELLQALDLALDEDLLAEDFGADPLDAHVARICEELGIPSPLVGEGVGRSPTDEGSHGPATSSPPTHPDRPARPLIRPAGPVHLLSQGEKDSPFSSG